MTGVVYAFCGRARHGKDTAARFVQSECHEYESLSFAALLKQQCAAIFGHGPDAISVAGFYDDDKKDAPYRDVIELDHYVPEMRRVTGLDIQPLGLTAWSGRDVMKAYGTRYVRGVKDDYWITNLPEARYSVVTDLRFANEAAWLRKTRKARVIKVVRGSRLGTHKDTHPSESGVDEIVPDLLLVSHNDNKALHKRVGTLLGMGYWRMAKEYDYGVADLLFKLLGAGYVLADAASKLSITLAAAHFLSQYYDDNRPSLESVGAHLYAVDCAKSERQLPAMVPFLHQGYWLETTRAAAARVRFGRDYKDHKFWRLLPSRGPVSCSASSGVSPFNEQNRLDALP